VDTNEDAGPAAMRKETRDWLASHTVEDVRAIAADLENVGEDVTALRASLSELEAIVNRHPMPARRTIRRKTIDSGNVESRSGRAPVGP